jgi:hypothetical protein
MSPGEHAQHRAGCRDVFHLAILPLGGETLRTFHAGLGTIIQGKHRNNAFEDICLEDNESCRSRAAIGVTDAHHSTLQPTVK